MHSRPRSTGAPRSLERLVRRDETSRGSSEFGRADDPDPAIPGPGALHVLAAVETGARLGLFAL